jgi:fibronectin-binding autotransporter adhesin
MHGKLSIRHRYGGAALVAAVAAVAIVPISQSIPTAPANGSTQLVGAQAVSSDTTNPAGNDVLWIDDPNNPSNNGDFVFSNNSTYTNDGTFQAENDRNFTGSGTFTNNGVFSKLASNGTTTFSVPLNNNGQIDVETGTISIQSGGSGTGTATIASGATLAIGGSTFTSSGALDTEGNFNITGTTANVGDITGAGNVYISGGGTSGLNASSINVGSLSVYYGQVHLTSAGTTSTVSSLSLANAYLIGTASGTTGTPTGPTVNVLGNFNNGNAGSFRLSAGVILNLAGADTITGFCNVDGDSNAAVNILAGGTLTLNTNYLNTFYNPTVTVAGEVDVNQGTLQIDTGGTHSGTFNVASGATASVNGAFSSTAAVNNSGLFQFITSAGSDSDPAYPGETGHNFNGTLTVQPGGTLATFGIALPFGVQYFTNQSTVTMGPATTLTVVPGTDVLFNNQQALNIGTANFGGGTIFRNPGLTIGVATLSSGILQFQNTGTVTIGTLNQTAAGQNILFTGRDVNLATTVSVGTFNFSGGAESGEVSVTGAMNWTGGVINADYGHVIIEPGATLSISGTGGTISQSGKLDVSGTTYSANNLTDSGETANSLLNFYAATTTINGNLALANTGSVTGGSSMANVVATIAAPATVNVTKAVILGNTNGGDAEVRTAGRLTASGIQYNDVIVTGGTVAVTTDTNSADNIDPVVNGSMVGGYLRNGEMDNQGGAVSAPYMKLGVTAGNTGTFTQTAGSGSFGIMGVGNSGTLTSGSGTGMAMVSGGSIFTETLLLGSTAGGAGEMTVSGGSVTIGGGAHLNDLNVDGGTVTVLAQAAPAGEDPELYEALVGGYLTNGALNVNGGTVDSPNIKLGITGGTTGTFDESSGDVTVGTLAVGNDASITSGSGTGVADISGGSLYVTTLLLGDTNGGSGQMVVSGDADVTIGGGAHLNDLTVEPGTVVTVLDQDPPADEDRELNRALVGGYLTNGALNVYGGQVTTPYIKLGITQGYTGTFAQTAGTVSVGTLCVGNDVITSSGSGVGSVVISGGTLSIGTLQVGSTAASAGVGTVVINGSANVSVSSVANFLPGVSTLYMTGGTLTMENANLALPSGTTTISYDGISANMPVLHLHNSIVSGGTALSIGTATLDGGGSAVAGENVGSVSLSGVSLTLSSSATLHMALGGDPTVAGNAGTTFDQITESGGVFTAGGATLQILALSNVVLNEPYPIIVASNGGSIDYSNAFSNLETDQQFGSGALVYSLSYSPDEIDLTLTATPEPGSLALLAACGLPLLRRRQRRPLP